MKKIAEYTGRVAFWITWPALYMYMRNSHRTRVLIMCGDEMLLLKHWLGRNQWQVPGGGLHKNESVIAGGIREVQEEVGIVIKPSDISLLGSKRALFSGIPMTHEYLFVRLEKKPVVRLQPSEIRDYRWISTQTATPVELVNVGPLLNRALHEQL